MFGYVWPKAIPTFAWLARILRSGASDEFRYDFLKDFLSFISCFPLESCLFHDHRRIVALKASKLQP